MIVNTFCSYLVLTLALHAPRSRMMVGIGADPESRLHLRLRFCGYERTLLSFGWETIMTTEKTRDPIDIRVCLYDPALHSGKYSGSHSERSSSPLHPSALVETLPLATYI